MSKNIFFLILILISSYIHNIVSSTKPIVFPLYYNNPNEPTIFEPSSIVTYYARNDIYTSIKVGKPPMDLTILLDDTDCGFVLKDGPCASDSDYTLSESSTVSYNDGLIYQYFNDELRVTLNNTKDKIYLKQAERDYFYLSLKNRRFGQNLTKIEIDGFNFLYVPTQSELNYIYKKIEERKKKEAQKKEEAEKTDNYDDIYKNEDDEEEDYDPFTPYYPSGDDEDEDAFTPKCGYLGMLPQGMNYGLTDAKINFIQQLKNKKIIDNYNWYIRFNKDKTGELVIGAAPHEVKPENYNEEDLYTTHARLINDLFFWEIDFSTVEIFDNNSNKKYSLKQKNAVLSINDNYIFCPREYYDNITEIFFKPYFNNRRCVKERINKLNSISNVIYCYQRNFTENDLKKFPVLLFKSNDLNYIFNLDYNDLFYKTKNVYIFKVIQGLENIHWKLGKVFLEKYQFVFNYDSKTFGFYQKFEPENIEGDQIIDPNYNPNNKKNENDKLPPSKRKEMREKERLKEESKAGNALKIILIIGLIIFVVFLMIYIWKKFSFNNMLNSNKIEGHQKYGKSKKKNDDNLILDDSEEIKEIN